jgi:glycosyltransferase involved in cell wall biosynthesis
VRGQAKSGLSVGVICDSSTEDTFAFNEFDELEPLCSLGIRRIPMSRLLGTSDLRTLREISNYCQKTKPNIIHGHGAKGGAYARLLASRVGAKSIYTPHGGSLHYATTSPAGVIYMGLERFLKRGTDGLIFESQYSADTYARKLGSFPCRHKVIHNGLKDHEFDCWTDKDAQYDFVYVGEMRKLKGIDVLLEAIAELQLTRELKVLLVGAGPDEAYFKERIGSLNIERSITLSGPIFPATDAFNQGRCVVMPSLAESFPYIVLETIAAGCPLITTSVGGIPEIFGPHKDALLPAGDAQALSAAMKQMMDNPDQALIKSQEIQGYVKSQFSLEKMLDEIDTYYREVL